MACSRYDLYFGGTAGAGNGVLSATYLNCGDQTLFTLSVSGGLSGAYYGQIIATTGSVTTYTGYTSGGGAPIPGFVYPYQLRPWAAYTYAVTSSGALFVPLTAAEVPPTNP